MTGARISLTMAKLNATLRRSETPGAKIQNVLDFMALPHWADTIILTGITSIKVSHLYRVFTVRQNIKYFPMHSTNSCEAFMQNTWNVKFWLRYCNLGVCYRRAGSLNGVSHPKPTFQKEYRNATCSGYIPKPRYAGARGKHRRILNETG
jgi:hypothetical protein